MVPILHRLGRVPPRGWTLWLHFCGGMLPMGRPSVMGHGLLTMQHGTSGLATQLLAVVKGVAPLLLELVLLLLGRSALPCERTVLSTEGSAILPPR